MNFKNEIIMGNNTDNLYDTQAEIVVQNNIGYIPKVSVIIPVYNIQLYLRKCLDSVVNQTLKEIEIICIDDKSTDGSLNILKEYALKDNRITVISLKTNKGVSIARNTGIDATKGEYIGFVDSDDWVDLDFYEILYKKAQETNAEVVKGGLKLIFPEREIVSTLNQVIQKNTSVFYFSYDFYSAIYNRKFIINNAIYFPTSVLTCEDRVFLTTVNINLKKLVVIDNCYYCYLQRENSKVKQFDRKKRESFINSKLEILKIINNADITVANYKFVLKNYIIHSYIWRTMQCLKLNKKDTVRGYKELIELIKPELKYYCDDLLNFDYDNVYYHIFQRQYFTFGEHFFSIKNLESSKNKWYKVIYFLGLKFSFRNKRKEKKMALEQEKQFVRTSLENLTQMNEKLKIKLQDVEKKANKYISFLNTHKINKEKIFSEMQNRQSYSGVTDTKRDTKLIVSLTSYPGRMYDIHYSLYSLLNQTLKPDEVILWLGEDKFPNKEADVPKEVLKLKNNGLTIKFTKDIKSYTKLIPTLKEYPNDLIVTADDDIYYPQEWLEKLYNVYQKDTQNIICHRVHKMKFDENKNLLPYLKWEKCIDDCSCSYTNFLTGVGGVLYPPNSFYKDIFNEDLFMQLCPNQDDIWFWAMAILNKKKIRVVENSLNQIIYVNPERELGYNGDNTLYASNKTENNDGFQNIINHYPDILDIINNNEQDNINNEENICV